jgi:hypothetical protein
MNTYKVGDKVLYNGEVHTVIQVPDDRLTRKDVGYLDKDYVVLDLHYDNAIHYTEIEPYLTPHEKLIELGFTFETKGHYIQYNHEKKDMRIIVNTITKDYGVFHLTDYNYRFVNLELSKILTEYLEELENKK